MDQLSITGEISCCQIVCKTVLLQEAVAEAVVPDSMPDIERILDAQCALYIRSRSLENGCVTLEGNIQGTVLYAGEGEDVPLKMEMNLPLTMTAQEEALTDAESMVVGAALRSCDAKMIHSRKLQLRAEAAASVTAFRPGTMDFNMHSQEPDELETLTDAGEIGYIASVAEKNFVVSDEVTLPGGAPVIDRILTSRLEANVQETKPVASKMLLQGEAVLEIVYLSPGEPTIHSSSFAIPFSQIMDMPEEIFDLASVTLLPTSSFVEPLPGLNGTNSVSAELHLTAQAVCTARREISYVADAYCLRHPCQIEKESRSAFTPFGVTELSQTLSDTVDLPEKGGEVCFAAACASVPIFTENTVRLGVTVRVVYRTESGMLFPVSRRLQAEWKRDPAVTECLCSQPLIRDVEALIHGDDLELRCSVTMFCLTAGEKTVSYVRAAQVDAQDSAGFYDGPSVVVVRPGERSHWELAKQYGSTVALIEAVNTPSGALLLIPRAR